MKKIAIFGFGTVGSILYKLLKERREIFLKSINEDYEVVKILVRDKEKYKYLIEENILTDSMEDIFSEKVNLIFEATGSCEEIIEDIKRLIENGVDIITANKALVSKYFEELLELSNRNNTKFRFEASACAALPIVNQLKNIAIVNDIEYVHGVVNGTCNFILSEMERGKTYESALQKAKDLGFAEANPSADIDGYDSMRKLRIISSILFNKSIKEENIQRSGIGSITLDSVKKAFKDNKRIKLVVFSDGFNHRVSTELVDKDSYLGLLEDGENAVIIKCSNAGEILIKGEGAGGYETSSAMLLDFVDIYGVK